MTAQIININEYLLRFAKRSPKNGIGNLVRSILIKSQKDRNLTGIVIDDGSKLAPAFLFHLEHHPECKYFRVGPSYSQIALATEMYIEICEKPPYWLFTLSADVIEKIALHLRGKKLKPLIIIDGAQWFKSSKLSSWISKMYPLRGRCGVIMVFNRESIKNLKNYEDATANFDFGYKSESFDTWYWFEKRLSKPSAVSRIKKRKTRQRNIHTF